MYEVVGALKSPQANIGSDLPSRLMNLAMVAGLWSWSDAGLVNFSVKHVSHGPHGVGAQRKATEAVC